MSTEVRLGSARVSTLSDQSALCLKLWVLGYPYSAKWRLTCAGWSESLEGAHYHDMWFRSFFLCSGSYFRKFKVFMSLKNNSESHWIFLFRGFHCIKFLQWNHLPLKWSHIAWTKVSVKWSHWSHKVWLENNPCLISIPLKWTHWFKMSEKWSLIWLLDQNVNYVIIHCLIKDVTKVITHCLIRYVASIIQHCLIKIPLKCSHLKCSYIQSIAVLLDQKYL